MRIHILIMALCFFTTANTMNPPFLQQESSWAQETLASLTLRQKIGQLFVVAAASDFEQPNEILASSMQASPYTMDEEYVSSLIQNYQVGGVIFLYKSSPEKQRALTEKFQQLSSIPLLIAQDCEWGLAMRLDKDPSKVVRYPHNMTLGAITDENTIYELGYEIGQQCKAVGVHLCLAPVVDVNNNPDNPVIHDRSFGDDPAKVARYGTLFAHGLHDAGMLACAKHFPGHGDTITDSHLELPVIKHDKKRLEQIELFPFKKVIQAGISAVMTAHLSVPAFDLTPQQPATMSYPIVTELLKNKMNFQGLVITDGLGMRAVTLHYKPGELELAALLAGNDIVLCPLDVAQATILIEEAVITGRMSQSDLDARVLKILKTKAWAFEQQKKFTHSNIDDFLIRPEACALQKKAYQEAVTVVKQSPDIIFGQDLLEKSCVIQIGKMPENIFSQECKKYTHNAHIYNAALPDNDMEACLQTTENNNTVIIALGQMNKSAKEDYGIAKNSFELIKKLKAQEKTVIVVVFGTPYSLSRLDQADSLMIAYEDAQQAQEAAAHVLSGMVQATGKLPVAL